ncbi:hypothetical protein HHI36_001073, partial [Cryptolaemus montrouzieri]
HWFTNNISNKLILKDYTFTKKSGIHGGVALLVASGDIVFEAMRGVEELSIESHLEMCAVKLPRYEIQIIGAYGPPSGNMQCFLSQMDYSLTCHQTA